MKICLIIIPVLLLQVIVISTSYGINSHESSGIVVGTALPYIEDNYVNQEINIYIPKSLKCSVQLSLYKKQDKDSLLLFDLYREEVLLKTGANTILTKLFREGKVNRYDQTFIDIVKQFELVPPGTYVYHISIVAEDNKLIYQNSIQRLVDSALSYSAPIKNSMDQDFLSNNKLYDPASQYSAVKNTVASKKISKNKLNTVTRRLQKNIAKKKGVTLKAETIADKNYTSLFYKGWFLGRYEVLDQDNMIQKIRREQQQLLSAPSSLVKDNFSSFPGITTQFKQFNKDKEKRKDILYGNISIAGHFGNGQEPGSDQDNNFQEYRATVHTKILGMPVQVEGYYTSQDKGRVAKASYIRLHYDVEQAKNELNSTISSYKSKYNQALQSGSSLSSIYGSYLNQLNNNQSTINNGLSKEYGIDLSDPNYTEQAVSVLVDSLCASSNDSSYINKLRTDKDKIIRKYNELAALQKDILKYKALLDQYQSGIFFDSVLVYDKVKSLDQQEDVSYKDMLKAAQHILPKGKANDFLSGLTGFDIGIINKYESNYTISGQTIKGGSIGYDLGFVKTTFLAGKTEYISRTGNLDRYNSYLLGAEFPRWKQQQVKLLYYIYSPTQQVFESSNFKSDVVAPTFKSPIHIPSISYQGAIAKNLHINAEGAVSLNKNSETKSISKNNTALTTSIDYNLNKYTTTVSAEYEHVGKQFENSSLPYIRAATERYKLGLKKSLFKSYLLVGLQFNYFKQESFATTGYNKKWGFDIRTKSKRYPNVYLSYKPYTTFRTFNDTFSIEQRPLVGEVWIANGSYQIKRKQAIHRFMLTLNRNTAEQDTIGYSSNMMQASYLLNYKKIFYNINVGWSQLPQSYQDLNKKESYIISNVVDYRLAANIGVNLNESIAFGNGGIQRLAVGAGGMYSFKKLPIKLLLNTRYTNFSDELNVDTKNIWYGSLAVHWQFRSNDFKTKRYN